MGIHYYIDLWNTINKGMIAAIGDQKVGLSAFFHEY
jgi:hypothetical protein